MNTIIFVKKKIVSPLFFIFLDKVHKAVIQLFFDPQLLGHFAELFHGHGIEILHNPLARLSPDQLGGAMGFPATFLPPLGRSGTEYRFHGFFHRPDHVAYGNVLWLPGQVISSLRAANAFNNSRPFQFLKNLLQVSGSYSLPSGNLFDLGWQASGMVRDIENCPDPIPTLG
jgi:hypothetical protein